MIEDVSETTNGRANTPAYGGSESSVRRARDVLAYHNVYCEGVQEYY
jgi:hypothetical protein